MCLSALRYAINFLLHIIREMTARRWLPRSTMMPLMGERKNENEPGASFKLQSVTHFKYTICDRQCDITDKTHITYCLWNFSVLFLPLWVNGFTAWLNALDLQSRNVVVIHFSSHLPTKSGCNYMQNYTLYKYTHFCCSNVGYFKSHLLVADHCWGL